MCVAFCPKLALRKTRIRRDADTWASRRPLLLVASFSSPPQNFRGIAERMLKRGGVDVFAELRRATSVRTRTKERAVVVIRDFAQVLGRNLAALEEVINTSMGERYGQPAHLLPHSLTDIELFYTPQERSLCSIPTAANISSLPIG